MLQRYFDHVDAKLGEQVSDESNMSESAGGFTRAELTEGMITFKATSVSMIQSVEQVSRHTLRRIQRVSEMRVKYQLRRKNRLVERKKREREREIVRDRRETRRDTRRRIGKSNIVERRE